MATAYLGPYKQALNILLITNPVNYLLKAMALILRRLIIENELQTMFCSSFEEYILGARPPLTCASRQELEHDLPCTCTSYILVQR